MRHSIDAFKYFIETQLELSYSRNAANFYNANIENNCIIAGGIRCSGATTACAEMFDPTTDVYVTRAYMMKREFEDKLIGLNKIKYRNELQYCLVSNIQTARTMNKLRGRDFSNGVIWIDFGNSLVIKNANEIEAMTAILGSLNNGARIVVF